MKSNTSYIKVSSYEGKIGETKKVLLMYSGGLDTSVIMKWIQDKYHAKVITVTFDLGQQKDDLEEIRKKALKFGAIKAIVLDVKEEFANEYLAKGIKANAAYQGDYHLSTPMGRAICAKKAVEIAKKIGISRNTVAVILAELRGANLIRVRPVGVAKLNYWKGGRK